MCANSEGSGQTVQMRRLAWAFVGHLCDKYLELIFMHKFWPMDLLLAKYVRTILILFWSGNTLSLMPIFFTGLRFHLFLITQAKHIQIRLQIIFC